MAIAISGSGTVTGITSITGTNATVTGVTSVSSNATDTPVIMQDSASNSNTVRAWVNFNGTGTVAINADFNVASITDSGVGLYTINFVNPMVDANYSVATSLTTTSGNTKVALTQNFNTTDCLIITQNQIFGNADADLVGVTIFR
jgi:hypothetical protein